MENTERLNTEFDISITFREKIEEQNPSQVTEKHSEVKSVLKSSEHIDWIIKLDDDGYNVYIGGKIHILDHEDLVKVIRKSPQLYYFIDKNREIFFHPKYIRIIDLNELGELSATIMLLNEKINIMLKEKSATELFDKFSNIHDIDVRLDDFKLIEVEEVLERYICIKVLNKRYLELTSQLDFNQKVYYFSFSFLLLPFFLGLSTFSLFIFPLSIFLICFSFYNVRRIRNKFFKLQ